MNRNNIYHTRSHRRSSHKAAKKRYLNSVSLWLCVGFIILLSMAVQAKTVAIRFNGDSTVERYAAEELHRYLSRVSDHRFILRDATLPVWVPEYLTPPHPVCVARAQKAIEARAKDPNYKDPETDRAAKAQFEEEKTLPAFVLGTAENYPEYAAQFAELVVDIREGSDGYAIAASDDGSKLFITAHTSRGVLYGVYHYLQNRCGMGFFEDGEYLPDSIDASVVPPFESNPEPILQEPKHDYRGQWLWSRYYGADKGHPANWGYDEWVSHLRWMAQNRFSSAMVYAVGYTRIWGDVFRSAFPEVAPYDVEVFDDAEDFWGAHWSARAGWGRSPEETTRLMQKVYAFGREKLGLRFEYNFYLGDFEDTLRRAYPEGKWIDWTNVPHHAYFGAAGRQSNLAFTDPKCKEYSQRLWKEFIKTFGTDHRYWISYREESAPNPDNPFDPDQGKSLADAVNTQREWLLEVDPNAEFYHWDWHELSVWFDKDILENHTLKTLQDAPKEHLKESAKKYIRDLSPDITCVSVLPPIPEGVCLPDLTDHYEGHPWLIGSLLGYAMQDLGFGGLYIPVDRFLATWKRLAEEDGMHGSRLDGVFHWNEIAQVSPLLDYVVAKFAWTGGLPENLYDATMPDEILDWYFKHRFGVEDAATMRRISAVGCANFQQVVASMRIPIHYTKQGITEAEANQRKQLLGALGDLVSIKNRQDSGTAFKGEVLDFGRIALHNIARLDLEEAIGVAANSTGSDADRKAFEDAAARAVATLTALGDLLATDQRYCVGDTLYRMLNEPGVNRQMRQVLLEHASGLLFDNYPLNDSSEFIKLVSVPLLEAYLANMRLAVKDPVGYPFARLRDVEFIDGAAVLAKKKTDVAEGTEPPSIGLDKVLLELKNDFMELPALPFEVVRNRKHPADVLGDWMTSRSGSM